MVRNIKGYTNKRPLSHRGQQRQHVGQQPHHHGQNEFRGMSNPSRSPNRYRNNPPSHLHTLNRQHGHNGHHFHSRGHFRGNRQHSPGNITMGNVTPPRQLPHQQTEVLPNYAKKDPRNDFMDRLKFATNPTATHFTYPENLNMYVIMVDSVQDVHKSIKYGKWSCPNSLTNAILDELYHKKASKKSPIYLLFTTRSSKFFFGIAQMRGRCHFDEVFPLWHKTPERCGLFYVEWLFIKDYEKKAFQDILITRETRHPMKRDTQEYTVSLSEVKNDILINNEQAVRTILKRFIRFKHKDSVLKRWERFEQDEILLRRRRLPYIKSADDGNMLPFKYRSRSISSISDDVYITSVDEANDVTIPTDISSVKNRIRERSFEVDTNLKQLFKGCIFMYEFTYLEASRQSVQPLIEKRGGTLQRTFIVTTVTHVITSQKRLNELPDRLIPVIKKLDKIYLINAHYVHDCIASNTLLDLEDPSNKEKYFLKIPKKGLQYISETPQSTSEGKSSRKKSRDRTDRSGSDTGTDRNSSTIYLPSEFWNLFEDYMKKKSVNIRSNAFRTFSNFLLHAVSEFQLYVENDEHMKQLSDSNKQRQQRKRLGKIFIMNVWNREKSVLMSDVHNYISRVNSSANQDKMEDEEEPVTGKEAVTQLLEQWCLWDARMVQNRTSSTMPKSFLEMMGESSKLGSYNNKQSAILSFCTFVSVNVKEAADYVTNHPKIINIKQSQNELYRAKIKIAKKWVREHWEEARLRDKLNQAFADWENTEHRSKHGSGVVAPKLEDMQLNVKRQKFIPIKQNIYIGSHWKETLAALPSADKCSCLPHCISQRMYMPRNGDECCGERCMNRASKIECTHEVHQPNTVCTNQRIQSKKWKKTVAKPVKNKGIGLFAQEEIKAGDFVLEYVGEVINIVEMERRKQMYQEMGQQHYYFMRIDNDMIIDSFAKANNSRYINHSCDPNLTVEKWKVGKKTAMGFFALRDIAVGEELAYDYSFQRFGSGGTVCFCGAKNCRGIIQAKSSKKATPFEVRLKKHATQLRNDIRRILNNYQQEKPLNQITRLSARQQEAVQHANLFLMRNVRRTATQRLNRIEAIRELIEQEIASAHLSDESSDESLPDSLLATMSRSEIRQYRKMLGKDRTRLYSEAFESDEEFLKKRREE